MTDKSNKPVSMQKATVAGPAGAQRPSLVRALALAMVLSGLAAVIAPLTLFGQHDYLVRSLSKSQPDQKISTTTISSVSDLAGTKLASDLTGLVGQTLSDEQISTESDTVGATVKTALPTKNATDNQIKDQVSATKSAVSSQLKKISGSLTAAQGVSQGKALTSTIKDNLTGLQKDQLSPSEINSKANKAPSQILIQNLLLFAALAFVGYGAYVGRHWSKWAVPVIWVLASFTGTVAGFTSLLQLGADEPAGYKSAAAVSALALIVAVLLSLLRPSKEWFAAHRPAAPADGARRRGLFASRLPPPSATPRPAKQATPSATDRPAGRFGPRTPVGRTPAASTTSAGSRAEDATSGKGAANAKSKKRVAAAATSNGAAAARARAKTASKSRRTTES